MSATILAFPCTRQDRGEAKPTQTQAAWLVRGLARPGAMLPLHHLDGGRVAGATVRSCVARGWAEVSYRANLGGFEMVIHKLTAAGADAIGAPSDWRPG